MRAIKFVLSLSVFCAFVALATGVVQLFVERPDGTAKFAPHVSRSTANWYAQQTSDAARSRPVETVTAGLRRAVSSD